MSFMFKGRADEAARLQPFEISKIPIKTECIISLKGILKDKYLETDMRRLSKKFENTENMTITPPIDSMEAVDL